MINIPIGVYVYLEFLFKSYKIMTIKWLSAHNDTMQILPSWQVKYKSVADLHDFQYAVDGYLRFHARCFIANFTKKPLSISTQSATMILYVLKSVKW